MDIIESIGTIIAMLIMFPVMILIMHPVFGLLSLLFLNPFSWLYIGVVGILFASRIITPKYIRNVATAALSLGIIMMWISLFISYRGLPYNYINFSNPAPAALGGFPLTVFKYPPPALGSDVPPVESWGLFYLNLFFWVTVGIIISAGLRKHLSKQFPLKLFAASVIISLYGLGYLLVKFD